MRQDFRPTETQMKYFDEDLMQRLIDNGIIREDEYATVNSIDWYNWDNDPRWFVHVLLFNEHGDRRGYVEVDVWAMDWNGPDQPMGIEDVKEAGHGYPCISTQVVKLDKSTDDWEIFES
jgi:hypothetical protein